MKGLSQHMLKSVDSYVIFEDVSLGCFIAHSNVSVQSNIVDVYAGL